MKLFDFIKNFGKDEDGAVTVDWVVLTAALVGLGILILSVVRGGLEDLSSDIASELSGIDPGVAVSAP